MGIEDVVSFGDPVSGTLNLFGDDDDDGGWGFPVWNAIKSPQGISGLLSLWGMYNQQKNLDASNAATEGRFDEAYGNLQGLRNRQFGGDNKMTDVRDIGQNLAADWGNYRTQQMRRLQGMGEQGRKDIETAYGNAAGTYGQTMSQRGFSGSSLLGSGLAAIGGKKGDALARHTEAVKRHEIDVMGQVTPMAIQGRAQARQLPHQYDMQNVTMLNNLLASRNDIPPDMGNYLTRMSQGGAGSAPTASAPGSSWLPWAVGGAGVAAGTAGAAGAGAGTAAFIPIKAAVWCVSGDALVQMEDGKKSPLADVEVGDRVLGVDGSHHEVIEVDKGMTMPHLQDKGIEVRTASKSILVSDDHIIGDRLVTDIGPGTRVRTSEGLEVVLSVRSRNIGVVGDLDLEGGHDFYANGFPVGSMTTMRKATGQHAISAA